MKAGYDCIKAFSETDFTEDLKNSTCPLSSFTATTTDRSHRCVGFDVFEAGEERQAEVYPGFPHGMPTTHADIINADLLAFVQQSTKELAA